MQGASQDIVSDERTQNLWRTIIDINTTEEDLLGIVLHLQDTLGISSLSVDHYPLSSLSEALYAQTWGGDLREWLEYSLKKSLGAKARFKVCRDASGLIRTVEVLPSRALL